MHFNQGLFYSPRVISARFVRPLIDSISIPLFLKCSSCLPRNILVIPIYFTSPVVSLKDLYTEIFPCSLTTGSLNFNLWRICSRDWRIRCSSRSQSTSRSTSNSHTFYNTRSFCNFSYGFCTLAILAGLLNWLPGTGTKQNTTSLPSSFLLNKLLYFLKSSGNEKPLTFESRGTYLVSLC